MSSLEGKKKEIYEVYYCLYIKLMNNNLEKTLEIYQVYYLFGLL